MGSKDRRVRHERPDLAANHELAGGLHEIIPAESLKIFDSRELELLISGLPEFDGN